MTHRFEVATPSSDVTPVVVAPWVICVARLRVTAGFVVAAAAFWLARPSWGSLGLGAAIGLVGEGLRCWAAGHLEKAVEVTGSGPYRWTRHPLYVGSALLGVGFVIASRHLVVAALVVGYLAGSLTLAARLEEATLRVKFGDAYDLYVRGNSSPVGRQFSLSRAHRNGEVQALAGLAAALAVLAFKVVIG